MVDTIFTAASAAAQEGADRTVTFLAALLPLKKAGKLGVALFQFPPWFVPNEERFAISSSAADGWKATASQSRPGIRCGSSTWSAHSIFERKHGISHIMVDEPEGLRLMPSMWEVTAPIAVVLHGRNHGTWEKKGLKTASERFDYWYDKKELKALAPEIENLAKRAKQVHRCSTTGESGSAGRSYVAEDFPVTGQIRSRLGVCYEMRAQIAAEKITQRSAAALQLLAI